MPRPLALCAWAAALVQLGILALAALQGPRAALWGANAWTYLPGGVVALLGVAAMLGGVLVWRAPAFPARRRSRAAIALAAIPLLYVLRDRAHLLGDGRLWISVLGGTRAYHAHEPGAFALTSLGTWGLREPAAIAARAELLSIAIGAAALFLVFGLAARLADEPRDRWLALGMLASGGSLTFAFGYVEAYPWFWLAVILYLTAAWDASAARAPVWPAAALMGIAAAVHGVGFLLGPSLLALLVARRARLAAWALGGMAAALPIAFAYGVLPRLMPAAGGGEAGAGAAAHGAALLLGEIAFPSQGVPAWAFDQLNRWTLIAPAAWMLVPGALLMRARPGARGAPLGLAALGLMLPALLLDTQGSRGAALDWDAAAVAGAPLAALAAAWWGRQATARVVRLGITVAVAAGVFNTASFVALNASATRAAARVEDLIGSAPWSARTRAMAAEALATFHRDRGDRAASARAYATAADLDRGNLRLARNAAAMYARAGDHRRAADRYLRLIDRQAGDSDLWYHLGLELQAAGSADSAQVALRRATNLAPRSVDALNALARSLLHGGTPAELSEAKALLERSLALSPDQPSAANMRRLADTLAVRVADAAHRGEDGP